MESEKERTKVRESKKEKKSDRRRLRIAQPSQCESLFIVPILESHVTGRTRDAALAFR